ncbi:MAG: TetR/AcrR family transcriptional regulator [Byssovorax sp.]
MALRLIAERGIYGTRIEDITERSDLGKGAFYSYFPSKNALVAALVAEGVEVLCDEYLDIATLEPSSARIATVIRGHEAFFTEHPVFVVLFHQARGIAKMGAAGDDLQRVFVEYLRRIGDMLVPPGDLERTSAEARTSLAAVIVGAIAGYRSFQIAAGLGVDAETLTDVLTSGIQSAIARRMR